MPSNFTEHHNLSQWERTDKIQMEDFNGDNAKIDAALKAEADARASADGAINSTLAAHAAGLAKRGNCQIYTTSYVGNGKSGENYPTTLTFPGKPLLVVVAQADYGAMMVMPQGCTHIIHTEGNRGACHLTWQGTSVSWFSAESVLIQMTEQGKTYNVTAFFSMD